MRSACQLPSKSIYVRIVQGDVGNRNFVWDNTFNFPLCRGNFRNHDFNAGVRNKRQEHLKTTSGLSISENGDHWWTYEACENFLDQFGPYAVVEPS